MRNVSALSIQFCWRAAARAGLSFWYVRAKKKKENNFKKDFKREKRIEKREKKTEPVEGGRRGR